MNLFVYLAGTFAATIAITIMLCRYRLARKQPVSFGTLIAGPVIANVVVFLFMAFYSEGESVFTRDFWTGGKAGFETIWGPLGYITVMCVLPALAVIVYYKRRNNIPMSPLLTKRIEMSWLTLIAYFTGVILIIFGLVGFRTEIELSKVSSVMFANYLFDAMCITLGILTCVVTRRQYRGGLLSFVGAIMVGGALVGTVSMLEAHTEGRYFNSPVLFYTRVALFWAIGSFLVVIGHLRHRRMKQAGPNR